MLSKHTPFEKNESKEPRLKALSLKECKIGFIAHSKDFTYNINLVRSPYLGLLMFPFIQIKSNISKKSTSTLLTI